MLVDIKLFSKPLINFYVAKKDINDKIYSEGGRLIGEMCHHVDLSLFLLGKPYSISYADNDFKA